MNELLLNDVRRFSNDPDADEFSAALLVNRALDHSLDPAKVEGQVQSLVEECSQPTKPWLYLAELGFAGNGDSFNSVDNSRLDWLLQQRRGIPISLGVLLIHLARSLGRTAVGINFPGHFLVRVDAQLVDPFHMRETSEPECIAGLGQSNLQIAADDVFRQASPMAVFLRMLNNLKYQFARKGEWHRSLDMLDLQLAAQPESARLLVERGEMWWRLGAAASAREALQRAIALAEGRDPEILKLAQQRLNDLGSDDGLLH